MSVTDVNCRCVYVRYMLDFVQGTAYSMQLAQSTHHMEIRVWPCKWRNDAMQCRGKLTSRAENAAWMVGV